MVEDRLVFLVFHKLGMLPEMVDLALQTAVRPIQHSFTRLQPRNHEGLEHEEGRNPREVDKVMEERERHLGFYDELVREVGRSDEIFVRGEAVCNDELESGGPTCAADVRWLPHRRVMP